MNSKLTGVCSRLTGVYSRLTGVYSRLTGVHSRLNEVYGSNGTVSGGNLEVLLVSVISFLFSSFWLFRRFRFSRFGGFVSLFWVLVLAGIERCPMYLVRGGERVIGWKTLWLRVILCWRVTLWWRETLQRVTRWIDPVVEGDPMLKGDPMVERNPTEGD